jgi:hypothetical protein
MSKTWKWILGILLVLLVVGAFFAVGFAWRTHTTVFAQARVMPLDRNWNGPMMGRDNDKWTHPQIWQRDNGWQHPMMNSRGMGGGFFMLGGLAKLALFFGLLYGAYWLGRRNARITLDPAPAATLADVSAPEAESASPSPEAEPVPVSPKRGKKIA